MKYGDWEVLWRPIDVNKIPTIIVDYMKWFDATDYSIANLCKRCSMAGYLIKERMGVDSTAYAQFLTSLKGEPHSKVMELWDIVQDGYAGWRASNSYWEYSYYGSIDERSRITFDINFDDVTYRVYVTYKVEKKKNMGTAKKDCEVVIVSIDHLPDFENYGVYYSNMYVYKFQDFDRIQSAIVNAEACFTYNEIGRVRVEERTIHMIDKQYMSATGGHIIEKPGNMYLRFAVDKKHGYIHIAVLHFLLDGSMILHGVSNKTTKTNIGSLSCTKFIDALNKLSKPNRSIEFVSDFDGTLVNNIMINTSIIKEDITLNKDMCKLVKVCGDRASGFGDTPDKNYMVMFSYKGDNKVSITLTLLDIREATYLRQLFEEISIQHETSEGSMVV